MSIPQHIVCPITHQIFCNPVTIDDGYTYEKQAIKEWLKNHNTSPMAKNIINTKIFTTNIIIKNLVEEYLLKNPDEKKEQYEEIIIKHAFNWNEFEKLSVTKQKKYLDNVDLECEDKYGWKAIHYICRYSTPEMIKFIIEKGVELECETTEKWRPIHIICRYSTLEMIKFIIEKGVELECETTEKWRPIHYICSFSTLDVIEYASSKCDLTVKISKYGNETVNYDINDLIKRNPLVTKQPTICDYVTIFFNNIFFSK